jgi:ERCC4-type nuclease
MLNINISYFIEKMISMSNNPIKIIIDNRERNVELINAIEANGIEFEFRTVHVGDYVISDRVCMERKTVSDFESSLINGRLFEQIKRLKENYEFPILLLEGNQEDFRLKNNVINGTIASLYIDHGIEVICTYNARNSADIIANIARHEQEKEQREPSLKGGARAHTNEQFQEFIIGNIPGIGPKLAKSLLKHFKNIRNIANAEIKELTEVDKIGKKKAENIHNTINKIYEY